jgi:predicted nuclease of predicted toxin-antitoxin system
VRLLVDEGVDMAIVSRLRADAHDVTYVAELAPGATDSAVLELAASDERLLFTADKDFGELVFRQRRAVRGVLPVRLPGVASSTKSEAVASALAEHGDEMANAFSVVSPGLVRIRRAVRAGLTEQAIQPDP